MKKRKTIEQTIPVKKQKQQTQAVSMLHQIYIVEQMNVCKGYNGNRGEQKHNEKF